MGGSPTPPINPGSTGGGTGRWVRWAPPVLTLFGWCPRGPGGCPLCTHRLGGGHGHPRQPPGWVLGGWWDVGGGMHACGVHLHAGTRVCGRVRAGTRVCVGVGVCGGAHARTYAHACAHGDVRIHPCSPPPRCVRSLKHGNVCIYINTNIYIYTHTRVHGHVSTVCAHMWAGGGGGGGCVARRGAARLPPTRETRQPPL